MKMLQCVRGWFKKKILLEVGETRICRSTSMDLLGRVVKEPFSSRYYFVYQCRLSIILEANIYGETG